MASQSNVRGEPEKAVMKDHATGPSVTDQPAITGVDPKGASFLGPTILRAKDELMKLSNKLTGTHYSTSAAQYTNERLPATMKAAVFMGSGKVAIQDVATPTLGDEKTGRMEHAVILRMVATNICGSDLHMYRGTVVTAPGLVLGHEPTGEVVEVGRDVLHLKPGDICSVPFNVGCGRCDNCKEMKTAYCLNTNPDHPGAAYGYAGMGDWRGGQAEYMLVPYADFNLLKFPDREKAMKNILDLAMLSDILPTAFHGAKAAGVSPGKVVYISGAGPVGICAAASSFALGAAKVIVGDPKKERLENAAKLGCLTVDTTSAVPVPQQVQALIGYPEVDCSIEAVGFECLGNGRKSTEGVPEQAINDCIDVTKCCGCVGIPGVYLPPSVINPKKANLGQPAINFGLAWNFKALSMPMMGQAHVKAYNTELMELILAGRLSVAKALNVRLIGLEDVPKAYEIFNKGENCKYVIDPSGMCRKALGVSGGVGEQTISSASVKQETEAHKPL